MIPRFALLLCISGVHSGMALVAKGSWDYEGIPIAPDPLVRMTDEELDDNSPTLTDDEVKQLEKVGEAVTRDIIEQDADTDAEMAEMARDDRRYNRQEKRTEKAVWDWQRKHPFDPASWKGITSSFPFR
eukprot:gnl/MRDRNA2_/MRDRNA2_99032_c0_seq1.p1 gnl/MRDRNA2_/MRDRNA2_99032_c0~~gnl/MRDRNA2_/MRDRNA2_99032_c0_seq1.p1  ORF type:complete len:129 (+),score=31.68 gnl/MRDRNA2_/MRDRNA2_99032_c0_seq1:143-529(+)